MSGQPPVATTGSISSSDDASGQTIGPYRLLRRIGGGGQGVVYLAEDGRNDRRVALKILTGRSAMSPAAIERFRREAAVTEKLSHPGICPIYEIGLHGDVHFIAMQLIEGETLASRITTAREGTSPSGSTHIVLPAAEEAGPPIAAAPSPPPGSGEVLRIARLIELAARAVHAAHEAGVIHRDIKPGNMMVTPAGDPVILDFGLAEDLDSETPTLTHSGDLLGTLHYMSPEQIAAKRIKLDRRTDVWSLGVTLYESLTLKRPFEAPTREGLLQSIMTKEPVDPRDLNPAIPADLRVVVETALEKDRDRRYATALDLAEDLRRVRASERILAKPASPAVRLRRWATRNPVLATATAGAFAVLVTGLTIAVVLLAETRRERDAKHDALTGKTAALDDYDRLGDLSRLQRLVNEADALWPAEPSKVQSMSAWLKQAVELERRLDGHEAVLNRLRKDGVAVVPESRPATTQPTDSRPTPIWQFRSPAHQFKHDTTERLISELTAFLDPDPRMGLMADIRHRLAFAKTVQQETIGNYGREWAAVHDGLRIKPQIGLIPIGRDPASGLWEFAHLRTTAPGTDAIPKRGQDGRLVVTESMGLILVLLPGGSFTMGALRPDEDQSPTGPNVDPEARDTDSPLKHVTLDAFFLSKYEMTQGQWQRFVGRNPSLYAPPQFGENVMDLRNPVEQVSWEDCDLWLGRLGLRLPTEAQWEYAARGGTTTPRWTGLGTDGLAKAANLADAFAKAHGHSARSGWTTEPWDDGYNLHAPVGSFLPNPFGLHDVLGNVWEWCRDWVCNYAIAPDPGDGMRHSSAPPRFRAHRGGCYVGTSSFARSAVRGYATPDYRFSDLGVRPARPLDR